MTPQTLATLYAGLVVLPLTLQLALAAGALLGRFTLSGCFAGRLPPLWRGLAVVQAGLLAAMACAVLDRCSAINLGLAPTAFWLALATTGLTLLANAVSQSRRERMLWTRLALPWLPHGCLRGEAATANNTRIVVRHFAPLSIRCRVLPIGWGWYYLSTILDDYSRYMIAWKLCTTVASLQPDASSAISSVSLTSPAFIVVQRPCFLSDNSSSYVAAELADYLDAKRMDHVRGAPHHPQTQGKIERLHQTMKNRALL